MPDENFIPKSGIREKCTQNVTEWKRWLSLRRAVEPTTTTRSPAPFARGALRKSAAFFVSFRSLSRPLRDGSRNIPMHRGQRKVSKRLDEATEHNQTVIGHNRASIETIIK